MAVKQELFESLGTRQADSDQQAADAAVAEAAKEARRAEEEKVRKLVGDAKKLGERYANYIGGHAYLGGDALSRDYHSKWFNFAPVDGAEDTIIQLALERTHKVIRETGIETGSPFNAVNMKVRLYDTAREVASKSDGMAASFSYGYGVRLPGEDGELVALEPSDPRFEELSAIVAIFPELESTGESSH